LAYSKSDISFFVACFCLEVSLLDEDESVRFCRFLFGKLICDGGGWCDFLPLYSLSLLPLSTLLRFLLLLGAFLEALVEVGFFMTAFSSSPSLLLV